MNAVELAVFCSLFAVVVGIGLWSSRWRAGDLNVLEEWGLAGRRFGTIVTWFLQGGSLYTVYAFIAVPAHVYGAGAIGFFSIAYALVIFPVSYFILPRLWETSRKAGHLTAADFVGERFGSKTLTTAVALTGIVATLPYLALQVYGIEVCVAQLGVPVEASLAIAFAILAGITYVAGLRSAALISIAKDVLIWVTVIIAVVYIPIHLGGYGDVIAAVPADKLQLPTTLYSDWVTLALGSALALWLYPHTLTGTFSATSADVVRRNSFLLPVYTGMLVLLALMGYMAIAAGVQPSEKYGANSIVPALLDETLPAALGGLGLAAIAIGGLVPAQVMSIAAGNLFSRNVYKALIRPDASGARLTLVAKRVSLVVKIGAVAFILAVPAKYVVNFQLAGGVWILQTLPAVFLVLFVKGLNRTALLVGMLAGLAWGTLMLAESDFESPTRSFSILGGEDVYVGLPALALNLAVVAIGTALARHRRLAA